MNDFRTFFNPLIPLYRFLFSLLNLVLAIWLTKLGYDDYILNGYNEYFISIIVGLIILIFLLFYFLVPMIRESKNYLIKTSCIEEFNLITFRTRVINKSEIKGFSTSEVPYRIWTFQQIILYLNDNSKIEIMQFSYFNFSKIKQELIDLNYNYFGHEEYIWKWINSRVYKFDKK